MLKAREGEHSVTVAASTDHLAEVRNFVAGHAQDCGFSKQQVSDIRLAVDEAFTNIIEHAYLNDKCEKVELKLSCNARQLRISLFDSGRSFSIANYKEPDIKDKIKHKKRGGVGVYLIKELMDKVEYVHEDGHNEIRMIKKR